MKNLIVCLSLAAYCFFSTTAFSQTTFTSVNSIDWHEAGNWDNGLPSYWNPAAVPSRLAVINYGTHNENNRRILTYNALEDNRKEPDIALADDPATLISFGIGPTIGEFFGGTGELEVDFRTLAPQLEIGGGINSDGNGCAYGGMVVGKRNYYEGATTKWTLYTGGFAGYMSEDEEYEYLLVGAKVMTGFASFNANSAFWGIDFGLKVGYRMQLYEDEYGDDYSGITGGLEARYRFGF